MLQSILTFSHKDSSVISSVLTNFLPQVLDNGLLGFHLVVREKCILCSQLLGLSSHLGSEGLHIRVSVLPHCRPDLPPVDQPHVLVEVRLSDVLADGGEQVDECLQQVAGYFSLLVRTGYYFLNPKSQLLPIMNKGN